MKTKYDIQILNSLDSIRENEWQKLAAPLFPFVSYRFLKALEDTRCLGERTGWYPVYFLLKKESQIVAALVCYLKDNSFGEFIFDFAWAQAFEQQGLSYYPKLTSAVPFTAATGSKLLLDPAADREQQEEWSCELIEHSRQWAQKLGCSSSHALFVPEPQLQIYEKTGHKIRHSFQYHWTNPGYRSFDDFLQSLRSKRRKEILREREQVLQSGLRLERLTGPSLTLEHARLMHSFYSETTARKGGFAYLTQEFFETIFESMSEQILFVLARDRAGQPVGGALNYFDSRALYGRNWGCFEEHRSLHFEACYYQGIEFAIQNALPLFEAGAQGEHKFQRGFLPSLTYSAHHISDLPLKKAISRFIDQEKRQLELLFQDYGDHSPFSKSDGSPARADENP